MPDRPTLTAAQLREDAAAYRAQAQSFLDLAERYEEAADRIEGRVSSRLPSDSDTATIATMLASEKNLTPVRRGPKYVVEHPFPDKVTKLGSSMEKVAKELSKALGVRVSRQRVAAWYTENEEQRRPIPEAAVKFLQAPPWNIPRSAWRNGIKG